MNSETATLLLQGKRRGLFRPALCFALLLSVLSLWLPASHAAQAKQKPAELVFIGSAILTLDADTPHAEAVAVRAGRIVFVGNGAGAGPFIGTHTRVIDLGERMLMPAFHDAHMHPMSGGMRLLRCSLADAQSAQAVLVALGDCARRPASSPWLIATGLSEVLARDPLLNRRELDRIVSDRPLAIAIGPGFSLRVNSTALALAEPINATTDTQNTDIERDRRSGEATGLVSGEAMTKIRRLWPRPSTDEYRQALRAASAMANSLGIVSILDASVDADMLAAYHAADVAGELSVRIVAAQRIQPELGVGQIQAMAQLRDAVRSERLRADVAKIFLDGEFELHTAATLEPYLDDPTQRGEMQVDVDALGELVARLDGEGFDVHLHAMGDRAVRAGLDAVAKANSVNGERDRRHQIAHDQLVSRVDLPRFSEFGIIANVQPAWAWFDPANRDAEAKLGEKRSRFLVPIRSLFDAHARVVAGSDWPAPSMNPLDAIQIAMTRQPLDQSSSPWHPEQRVQLMQMLRAYCTDAAWALRLQATSGSITVGKSADLIVLDRDLRRVQPMELHQVRVLLTLLEGAPVYRNPAFGN